MNSDDAALRIAALERALEDAERRAVTDPLTGVLNRRGWDEALAREEDRCRRHELDAAVFAIVLDGSSRSTATGTPRATSCCAGAQQRSSRLCARMTSWRASAATSLLSFPLAPTSRQPTFSDAA
jgi:hypothetical protein